MFDRIGRQARRTTIPNPRVENVWKDRGSVVEARTVTTFFSQFSFKSAGVHTVDAPSMVLSLDRRRDHATLQRAVRLQLTIHRRHRL